MKSKKIDGVENVLLTTEIIRTLQSNEVQIHNNLQQRKLCCIF